MLIAIYHMLRNGAHSIDLSPQHLDSRHRDSVRNAASAAGSSSATGSESSRLHERVAFQFVSSELVHRLPFVLLGGLVMFAGLRTVQRARTGSSWFFLVGAVLMLIGAAIGVAKLP